MLQWREKAENVPSFRDGSNGWREGATRWSQTRNLEVLRCAIAHHSSLVSLAPRNDGKDPRPRPFWRHPFELAQLMPKPGELPLRIVAGVGAADLARLGKGDLALEVTDQRRHAVRLHGGQERIEVS